MILNLLTAFLTSLSTPAEKPVCLGVFLPREDRVLRIMWVDVTGEKTARQAFGKAALQEGYTPEDLKVEDAKSLTHLVFVSPRTTFAMADDVIQRARKGEFGLLNVDTMVMRAADGEMQKCTGPSGDRG